MFNPCGCRHLWALTYSRTHTLWQSTKVITSTFSTIVSHHRISGSSRYCHTKIWWTHGKTHKCSSNWQAPVSNHFNVFLLLWGGKSVTLRQWPFVRLFVSGRSNSNYGGIANVVCYYVYVCIQKRLVSLVLSTNYILGSSAQRWWSAI